MNEFVEFIVRDAYFLKYGPAKANSLTAKEIESAIEALGGTKATVKEVVEKLGAGKEPSVTNRENQ